MKRPYTILIALGILIHIILLIFFDTKIAAFGPVIFWAIALILILNYVTNILKLSESVKKTKPDIYRKYCFGFMINKEALSDPEFLNALNKEENEIIENNKTLFKYLFLCFILFLISALLLMLK